MTYDYECTKCKNSYSIERSMYDTEILPICVTCHESMTRVWAIGGITFNGVGFYSTDNKH
jgi:putative FmdB family regulatory protein